MAPYRSFGKFASSPFIWTPDTVCRNKPLAVIGGGDSAAEEATYLTKYASHVYVLVRRNELRASKIMAKRLTSHPKIVRPRAVLIFDAYTLSQTILWNTIPIEATGDGDLLNGLRTKNNKTGEISNLAINGLFYAIGHEPATSLIRGQVDTDSDGYITTVPGTTLTNIKGVFAAGDVQDKRYRQAITSAGSGTLPLPDFILYWDVDFDSYVSRLHGRVGG